MEAPLTDTEVRILGSLVEKEVTTPDNYPLSMSALLAACNQISNRDPVMQLDEDSITPSVVAVRRRGLVRPIQPSGSRVTKYQHLLADAWNLDARELALLATLMLRGPQTLGELHARALRLAEFADVAQVEATLEALIARQPEPLVVRLPRRPGQKEPRYAHLLSGEPSVDVADAAVMSSHNSARASADEEQLVQLQRAMDELRAEMDALRAQFEDFRSQFQ